MNKIFVFIFCLVYTDLIGQNNVGIGTTSPDTSSILEIKSVNKGVLVPRMSASERINIVNPANGLLVFDNDSSCFYFYILSATKWQSLCNKDTVAVTNITYIDTGSSYFDPRESDGTDSLVGVHVKLLSGQSYVIPNGYNFHGSYINHIYPSSSGIQLNGDYYTRVPNTSEALLGGNSVVTCLPNDSIELHGYITKAKRQVVFAEATNGYVVPVNKKLFMQQLLVGNVPSGILSSPFFSVISGGCIRLNGMQILSNSSGFNLANYFEVFESGSIIQITNTLNPSYKYYISGFLY